MLLSLEIKQHFQLLVSVQYVAVWLLKPHPDWYFSSLETGKSLLSVSPLSKCQYFCYHSCAVGYPCPQLYLLSRSQVLDILTNAIVGYKCFIFFFACLSVSRLIRIFAPPSYVCNYLYYADFQMFVSFSFPNLNSVNISGSGAADIS